MKHKYFLFLVLFLFAKPAFAQGEPFVGEIRLLAGSTTFIPNGWRLCDGSLLTIQANAALFSILGAQFGGNGTTNFALPNFNGNMAVGTGQGTGLAYRTMGESDGSNTVTVSPSNLPFHNHISNLKVSTEEATSTAPGADKYLAAQNNVFNGNTRPVFAYSAAPTGTDISLNPVTTTSSGSNIPLNIQQPVLAMTYIICLNGTFPQFQ